MARATRVGSGAAGGVQPRIGGPATHTWMAWVALLAHALSACGSSHDGPIDDGGVPLDGALRDATPTDGGNAPDAGADTGPVDGAGADADANACHFTPIELEAPDLEAICGGAPATLAEWEQCYLERRCEWTLACGERVPYRDVEECVAWREAASHGRLAAERRERQRAVEQGLATLDEDAFGRCLAEMDPSLCYIRRPACHGRFVGTVEDGGACYGDVECASLGAECARETCTEGCCQGTCEPPVPQGGDCLVDRCAPGLYCALGDACSHTGHTLCCLPRPKVGEPCTASHQCEVGAWCDTDCGICRNALPEGAPCTSRQWQCGGQTACVGLSLIDGDPGRCARVSEPGDDCDVHCRGPMYCGLPLDTVPDSSCRPLQDVGEPCATHVCLGITNACTGEDLICTERTQEGDPCEEAPPCLPGHFCSAELGEEAPVCTAPQGPGAPCTHARHCASYRCSGAPDAPGTCLAWSERCPD